MSLNKKKKKNKFSNIFKFYFHSTFFFSITLSNDIQWGLDKCSINENIFKMINEELKLTEEWESWLLNFFFF